MLLALLTVAWAQSIPLNLQPGRFVYTWPASWRPEGVSADGLAEIERDIKGRHYPFYVVLIQGEALPGTGDGMERLQVTTDALMSRWGGQGMDLSEYSVFSVAWGEDCDKPPPDRRSGTVCKYFLNTGSTFINGPAGFLPSRDHEAYTDRFLQAVSTTPQDPKGGVLAVIDAVDDMLWERTDPAKLGARAEENLHAATEYRRGLLERASEQEAARYSYQVKAAEVALARGNTDEMTRMAEEMRLNSESLAARIEQRESAARGLEVEIIHIRELIAAGLAESGEYDALLASAEEALSRRELTGIQKLSEEARKVRGELTEREVARREREKRKLQAQMGAVAVGGGGLFAGIIGLGARRRRVRLVAERYEAERERIATGLDNAAARYMSLELDDRETLAALQDTGGRTGEECRSVGAELDDIYAGIRALLSHLDHIDARVAKLGALSVAPWEAAAAALAETFTYDTGELVKDDLFGGETRVIRVDGGAFMAQLQDRFAAVIARRQRLLLASEIRFKDARSQLPHTTLDGLLARLRSLQVPARWVSDHPLYGDDDSDRTLYDRLDALRQDDPLAWLEELEALRAVEAAGVSRVDALQAALDALEEARLEAPPAHPDCVLEPADDPTHTFSRARSLEDTMRGLIAEGAVTHALEPVLQQAAAAREAWLACHSQAEEIRSAVAGLAESTQQAERLVSAAAAVLASARQDLTDTSATFSRAHIGIARLDAGDAALSSARLLVQRAEALRREHRLLDAYRTLSATSNLAGQATQEAHHARDHLRRMEEERREYQRRLGGLAAARASAAKKIQGYGGSTAGLPEHTAAALSGPQDFSVLCGQLDALEESWAERIRVARRAHEAEQRRAREAAERARQAAEQARRSAAQASRSSWQSSSSGTSFSAPRSHSFSHTSSSSSSRSHRSSGGGGSFGGRGRSSGGGGGW